MCSRDIVDSFRGDIERAFVFGGVHGVEFYVHTWSVYLYFYYISWSMSPALHPLCTSTVDRSKILHTGAAVPLCLCGVDACECVYAHVCMYINSV